MPDQFGGSYGGGSTTGSTGGGSQGEEGVGAKMSQKARDLKETVTERAAEKVNTAFDAQRSRAVESVSGIADALRQSAEAVGSENQGIGTLMYRAADMIENVTSNFENKDLDQLVWDVQTLARRNPAIFFGGALALGFAAARFLKASNERYISTYGGGDYSNERSLYGSDFERNYGATSPAGTTYASELGSQNSGSSYSSGNPISRPGSGTSRTLSDREDSSRSGLVSYGEDV